MAVRTELPCGDKSRNTAKQQPSSQTVKGKTQMTSCYGAEEVTGIQELLKIGRRA